MRRGNISLRLQESLLAELRKAARADGVSVNHYINVAVAQKLAARQTAKEYFEMRAARAKARGVSFWALLERFGSDVPEPEPAEEGVIAGNKQALARLKREMSAAPRSRRSAA